MIALSLRCNIHYYAKRLQPITEIFGWNRKDKPGIKSNSEGHIRKKGKGSHSQKGEGLTFAKRVPVIILHCVSMMSVILKTYSFSHWKTRSKHFCDFLNTNVTIYPGIKFELHVRGCILYENTYFWTDITINLRHKHLFLSFLVTRSSGISMLN